MKKSLRSSPCSQGLLPLDLMCSINSSNGINFPSAYRSGVFVNCTDFNNDGFSDVFSSQVIQNQNLQDIGSLSIIFGKSNFSSLFGSDLNDTSNSNIYRLNGNNLTQFASSVEFGDFNGDGYKDIFLGAGGNNNSAAGKIYVVYGGPPKAGITPGFTNLTGVNGTGFLVDSLSGINGGFIITAPINTTFGKTLAVLDLNGDGFDDIVLSDVKYNSTKGRVYIIWGKATGMLNANLVSMNSSEVSFIDSNNVEEGLGTTIANAKDFNGDGIGDLLVSSNYNFGDGRVYLFYGDKHFATKNISELSNGYLGIIMETLSVSENANANTQIGTAMSAGNFNGDNYSDVIIGAPFTSPNGRQSAGQAIVYFGHPR